MIFRAVRQWWTNSTRGALLEAQRKLIEGVVKASIVKTSSSSSRLNSLEFGLINGNSAINSTLPTVVLCHGFGSGLGFFYNNVDGLLNTNKIGRLLLVDWLGMGGSERPPCRRPIRGYFERSSSWCDSRFTPHQAIDFFIDPLEDWMQMQELNNVTLVGHSLGGYLAARYALKYPDRLQKLVLASPVGILNKPENALSSRQMPTSIRILDALWWANVTPQQLVRMMGATRGRSNVRRALKGRIPNLRSDDVDLLADYLYHITVAHPSGEYAMNSLLEPAVSPELMGVFAREPLTQLQGLEKHIKLKIMYGDHDWMRPNDEASARRLVNGLGSSRASLRIIEGAGHHLYIENPTEFHREIVN